MNSKDAASASGKRSRIRGDGYFGERDETEAARHTKEGAGASGKATSLLDGQSKLLLIVHGLFAVGNALSGTFVNVYLWKAKQDFTVIGWFTIIHHLSMAITFWLAGKWVKEHNKMNCLRTGVAVSAVFYMLVLLLGARAVGLFPLLGIVQGMSAGLFWLAFNVVYFEVTDAGNRDKFNGWAGLLGSFSGMIAPWVSGFVIVRMGDGTGYRLVFGASLAIFVIGVVFSFFLKKRKAAGQYEWLLTVRSLRNGERSPWRTVWFAMMAQGGREGVFGFIIALLVYVSTGTEMKIGNFSLVTSAVALLSFWAAGKLMKPRYRKWSMLVGAVALVLIILPFFWKVSFTTLLTFGIGAALFFPLYAIPMTSSVFDLIGSNPESVRKREEYIVMRELGLNAGRILGTLVFTLVVTFTRSPAVMNWLLLIIGSSPLLAWLFIRRMLVEKAAKPAAAGEKA